MPAKVRAVTNIRALLRRLRPAGILLADEYHRQDWLTAARAEGIKVVAIQHGMIYGGHNGYIHRDRPASLALPDRTYVFGEWERDVLVERQRVPRRRGRGCRARRGWISSPSGESRGRRGRRGPARGAGRPAGDRLVVLSGTYGPAYRRFHIPYALDRLLDRPWPNVHLVVKQHPGEKDRGPYEALIRGLAAARGFEPPPVTVVQHIDLYRLLRSADAHLGIHSTVLTEAVAAGTRNLLADTLGLVGPPGLRGGRRRRAGPRRSRLPRRSRAAGDHHARGPPGVPGPPLPRGFRERAPPRRAAGVAVVSGRTLFLIPARGGSKRIPGKNVPHLSGIPLVGWAVRIARAAATDDDLVVCSTDDADIAHAGRSLGRRDPGPTARARHGRRHVTVRRAPRPRGPGPRRPRHRPAGPRPADVPADGPGRSRERPFDSRAAPADP